MPRRAAFFDLDGTLLSVNSAALWVARERRAGRTTRLQLAKAIGFFAAYRFGVLDIHRAYGEALLNLKGVEESVIREATRLWWKEDVARHHIAPGGRSVIEAHRKAGDLLVLLTTSSQYASDEAREQFGLDEVLCTRYEVRDGRFTGAFAGTICYGPGKVALAEELAATRELDLENSVFYTDSSTDLPMLERVEHPRIVNPDPRLRWIARRRGWPILDWRRL